MPDQETGKDYYGRILNGAYSDQLKSRLTKYIKRFAAFDEADSPAIPYISAWQEKQNIIWYEFVSRRLIDLLGCDAADAAESIRNSIIERHVYGDKAFDRGIQQEVIKQNEMQIQRSGLRAEAKKSGTVEAVYKIMIKDGKTLWLKDQAAIESFEPDGISISLGTLTIVTKEMEAEEDLKRARNELKKSEKKFREQAIHDNLTGLYNTRYLYKALSQLIDQSASANQPFSLIFMDIDNFKQVVDTHGHLNASKALQEIAATLKTTLHDPSYGVAYGGDEFVLVLPGFNKQQGIEMAKKIRACIKDSIYLQEENLQVRLSASLGVSTYPHDANTLTALLALADQAMFSVKERGKDSVCAISYEAAGTENNTKNILSYDCKD
jgi:diguanylate cyclase (GGDEF)-like protein